MAVTDTGGVLTGTAEWAIYAALKHGGTLMSTDGLDDVARKIRDRLAKGGPQEELSLEMKLNLSVWITDSTGLVLIGQAGELDYPAVATAEGIINAWALSGRDMILSLEFLGIEGDCIWGDSAGTAPTALIEVLAVWCNKLKEALEH